MVEEHKIRPSNPDVGGFKPYLGYNFWTYMNRMVTSDDEIIGWEIAWTFTKFAFKGWRSKWLQFHFLIYIYWTFYKVCYTPPLYFFKLVIAVFKLVPKSKRQFQQKESWNVDMLVILCLCLCRKRKYQTSHKSLNKCNNHDERNVTPLKIRILKTNSH